MFPNAFLQTFWGMELQPTIFVAMSFSDEYRRRYEEVIKPAIEEIRFHDVPLKPYRVDLSKSGDSILSDIIDGIAHCQMFLADVSTLGHDSKTGRSYRNGNVMYEVGIAVACRQPTEVLLIRDDRDSFLFDVSTIPHMTLDFTDEAKARAGLYTALVDRLKERKFLKDVRVRTAIASLSQEELILLKKFADYRPPTAWGLTSAQTVNFVAMAGFPRLLDKHLIRLAAESKHGGAIYQWTELGWIVAQYAKSHLPSVEPDPQPTGSAPIQRPASERTGRE